jgi:hypothetical protein
MKKTLPNFKGIISIGLLLVLLACTSLVSGQQAQHSVNFKLPEGTTFMAHGPARNSSVSRHHYAVPATVCDTDLLIDYAAYNQVIAETQGLNYDGSWYNGTQLYANGITSYITKASGDSGYISYAGVVFDSLLFSNPLDTFSTYLSSSASTVYFDSLLMYTALTGDTVQMANDSIVIEIFSLTNGTFSATPVQTIVEKGWAQLKQFYAYGGYVAAPVVPVHLQLLQGQGMAVLLKYQNKHPKNLLSLLYSYADSCGTVVYNGSTIASPAYPPVLPGNEFYGSINADTAGIVDYGDNTYGYFGAGFATNCSYVYTQNWAIIPIVTVCQQVTNPTVTINPTAVKCFGQSTGIAIAVAGGGNGTFTYAWSNGATTDTISNLAQGTYTVTVTSNSQTVTSTTTIAQPANAVTAAPTATLTSCTSSTGTAAANAAGGTSGYTYLWSNSATTATLSGLSAATYLVTVTDANGCTATGSATVSVPPAFTASVTPTNVLCHGLSTGSATASTTGATGTLTYTWNSGSGQTISNMPAGNYTVTVTNSYNCSASASATISQPATAVTASATSTQTGCGTSTGTATVVASGGTGNLSYVWSPGNSTSTSLSNLGVGNYTVTVTDGNSCTATATTAVNTSATFTINVTSTDVNCYGQSTGTASASATGTSGTVVYIWSNGATAQNLSSLPEGTYDVTITDASNCPKTNSTIVTQPSAALAASVVTTPTNCSSNTGTATATVSGGTANYTFAWSNLTTSNPATTLGAGNVTLTVTDSKSCSVTTSASVALPPADMLILTPAAVMCNGASTGSVAASVTGNGNYTYLWSNGGSTATISNVVATNYSVTVTDGLGCTVSGTSTVSQPAAIQASVSITDATNGNNGTATVTASGGTTPLTYQWPASVTTATDSGLAAGTYTVTVTDANSCTATASGTIVATGINTVTSNITSITLIPNPANDVVKVVVSLASAQTIEVRLVDITGKYIYTGHEAAVQGNVTHAINVSQFAAGIYLVEITAGNDVTRQRLVIAK